jgi:hypothetical protein
MARITIRVLGIIIQVIPEFRFSIMHLPLMWPISQSLLAGRAVHGPTGTCHRTSLIFRHFRPLPDDAATLLQVGFPLSSVRSKRARRCGWHCREEQETACSWHYPLLI